jgi:hypothetical protein
MLVFFMNDPGKSGLFTGRYRGSGEEVAYEAVENYCEWATTKPVPTQPNSVRSVRPEGKKIQQYEYKVLNVQSVGFFYERSRQPF